MGRITRRKFLGSSAALPLGLGLGSVSSAQEMGMPSTGLASTIVTGANVYTMVWDNPKADPGAPPGAPGDHRKEERAPPQARDVAEGLLHSNR